MKPHFRNDLARGKNGEKAFAKLAALNGHILTATDGRSGDFVDSTGGKWELKTDSYAHDRTQNFFIERWSDWERKKPGGPFQAKEHGCTHFVYYFSNPGIAYVFLLDDLLAQLNKICLDAMTPVEIHNARWLTLGYKVPRNLLTPAFILNAKEKKPHGQV